MSLLGTLTPEQFLAEYWQKKPLCIRGALPDFVCPVTPEELGGLALEDEVESRLLQEHGPERPWQLEHGPFTEERFLALPPTHWTLLVQEINKHVPEFALLQDRFNFIPNWRLDDVMVSFAPEHGTVGPHADNYDVFLIQGPGRRRWQISYQTPGEDDLVPGLDLRIMRDFVPEQEWILEPGDMLYLPPGIPHHGVALEDCITISVGFRAPALAELTAAYCADVLDGMDTEQFYADPDLKPQAAPGEISAVARERIRAQIRQLLREDAAIDEWFGRFTTGVRPGHGLPEPDEELDAAEFNERLAECGELWRSEYARFAHYERDGGLRLFVAGEAYPLPAALTGLGVLLTGQRRYLADELLPYLSDPEAIALLLDLHARGCLFFPDDE